MAIIYTWADADQSNLLKYDDVSGQKLHIPAVPGNRDYAAFLASGETANDYVEPAAPAPLTAEQKLENAGLTVDELKGLLGI